MFVEVLIKLLHKDMKKSSMCLSKYQKNIILSWFLFGNSFLFHLKMVYLHCIERANPPWMDAVETVNMTFSGRKPILYEQQTCHLRIVKAHLRNWNVGRAQSKLWSDYFKPFIITWLWTILTENNGNKRIAKRTVAVQAEDA